MEDLLKIIVGVLGTIIVAGGGVIVAYFNSLKKRLEGLTREKNDYKRKKDEKEEQIRFLHNGFRNEVMNHIKTLKQNDTELKQDVKLIKQAITKEN